MKIGVLGTGMVGEALATKLISLGHGVMMGARTRDNDKAGSWAAAHGDKAHSGDFAEAASFGEIVFIATLGSAVLDAARMAGPANVAGKVAIDVTNPLDFSQGMPPMLVPELSNSTSAGEELQKKLPDAKVVKTLNTVNCRLMVDPSRVPGEHDVFCCGDDEGAKEVVADLLKSFGWKNPIDLGPLSCARGTEGMMPFWLRMWNTLGTVDFNYRIVSAGR